MKCPGCGTDVVFYDGYRGCVLIESPATPREHVHDEKRCASTRTPAPVRLVEAAKRVIDLYDEDQMDSLGFAARRMTAMTALRAALAEVDRG